MSDCNHTTRTACRRTFADGTVHYGYRCTTPPCMRWRAVKFSDLRFSSLAEAENLPDWDDLEKASNVTPIEQFAAAPRSDSRPAMSHTAVVHDVIRALNRIPFVRVFKNPVGAGYAESGNRITYGLAVGSSDIIGLVRGRFTAIEVKTGSGVRTKEQVAFQDMVVRMGGLACVARSVADAVQFVNEQFTEAGNDAG